MLPPGLVADELGLIGLALVCYLPCSDYYPEPDADITEIDNEFMSFVDVYVSNHPKGKWENVLWAERPFAGAIATAMPDSTGKGDDVGMTCITWYLGDIPCLWLCIV